MWYAAKHQRCVASNVFAFTPQMPAQLRTSLTFSVMAEGVRALYLPPPAAGYIASVICAIIVVPAAVSVAALFGGIIGRPLPPSARIMLVTMTSKSARDTKREGAVREGGCQRRCNGVEAQRANSLPTTELACQLSSCPVGGTWLLSTGR